MMVGTRNFTAITTCQGVNNNGHNFSGLLPNMQKSSEFFGGLSALEQHRILDIIPFNIGKLPVKYLGVPLITKKIGVKECKPLVDKVRTRVSNWKNKCLSHAGRLQLIASVLSYMQVFWTAIFLLPKQVIYDIERLLEGFLWCQGELTKGKAKVSWNSVCKPKEQGGLGLKNLRTWNEVLLMKHLWNVATKKETLWVPVNLNEKEDYAVWVNNLGHEKKFKTGDVWKDMCINDPKGECCEFTNGIWTEMNKRLNIGLSSVWDNIVQEIIVMPMNNNIWSIIRRLVCAAAVYFVWQERNKRMFGEEKRDSEDLIKTVTESVRMKLIGLKVKESRSVKEVERIWNVKMQRMIKESV
ncbi:hypothetical protein Tco_0871539 [Tanacetum coccineum]